MARKTRPELQPFYQLSELVLLTNTTRGRVLRMLESAGIPRRRVGGQKLVFVSDIKVMLPALWARNVSRTLDRLGGDR
jgi:hypothetical protein